MCERAPLPFPPEVSSLNLPASQPAEQQQRRRRCPPPGSSHPPACPALPAWPTCVLAPGPPGPTPPPHAGLITYRETALLVSNESSVLDRRYVSLVVAHEMAHQWFGNLVTMVGACRRCFVRGRGVDGGICAHQGGGVLPILHEGKGRAGGGWDLPARRVGCWEAGVCLPPPPSPPCIPSPCDRAGAHGSTRGHRSDAPG